MDNAKDIDVVMPMYNSKEHSNNYSKTSDILCQYHRDETNDIIGNSESFQFKVKITGKTPDNDNKKNAEIAVPLIYLSNFWRTAEMPLSNCEINLILIWSGNCVISSATRETKFKIIDTKPYVPVVTLSTQDNAKLLEQLKSRFKRTINCNKYQSKVSTQIQNQYLDFLIDPSSQGVNRLGVLLFKNEEHRKVHTGYYLPKVEIKEYTVMIDGKNFFDQPVKSGMKTYDSIRKIGQRDDCTTGCLLDYNYFKNYYNMMAIDLSKQETPDADLKAIQQINLIGNLDREADATMLFIIEELKETILDFSQGTVKVFQFYFVLI